MIDTPYILGRIDSAVAGGKLRPYVEPAPPEIPLTMRELLQWEKRRRRRFKAAGSNRRELADLRREYSILFRNPWDAEAEDREDRDNYDGDGDDGEQIEKPPKNELDILEAHDGMTGKLMSGSHAAWLSTRGPTPARCEVQAALNIPGRRQRPPGEVVMPDFDARYYAPMCLGIYEHTLALGLSVDIDHRLEDSPGCWPLVDWFNVAYEASGFSTEMFFFDQEYQEMEFGPNACDWSCGVLPVYNVAWFEESAGLLELLDHCWQAVHSRKEEKLLRIVLPDEATQISVNAGGGMKMKIPVITLWQPWASFIAEGWKSIETRTHTRFASLAGKRIAIHAGNHWDDHWLAMAGKYLSHEQITRAYEFQRVRGVIVCTAKVVKFSYLLPEQSQAALFDIDQGRWGLWLADIKLPEFPIPAVGHQGIWFVDEPLLQEASAGIENCKL